MPGRQTRQQEVIARRELLDGDRDQLGGRAAKVAVPVPFTRTTVAWRMCEPADGVRTTNVEPRPRLPCPAP